MIRTKKDTANTDKDDVISECVRQLEDIKTYSELAEEMVKTIITENQNKHRVSRMYKGNRTTWREPWSVSGQESLPRWEVASLCSKILPPSGQILALTKHSYRILYLKLGFKNSYRYASAFNLQRSNEETCVYLAKKTCT